MRATLVNLAAVTLCLLTACQKTITPPARHVQATILAADGTEIAYDLQGSGETTLVLLHGWCSNRTFWRDQIDAFTDDYAVATIDLPGHGTAGRDRETWTFSAYADDVCRVIDALELERVVLVGHSMGGIVALEVAPKLKGRVVAVVGVDILKNVEAKAPPEMFDQIAGAFEADFEGTMHAFLPQFFPADADAALVRRVIDQSCLADRPMAAALMRDQKNVDKVALMSAVKVPVRCINAAAGDPGPPATEIEINRKYADFDAVFVDGVGHFPHMERPEAFNAQLRSVLDSL